jgi:hypothetical protein
MGEDITYVQKKRATIYCKVKDQTVGLEIAELAKAPNTPDPHIRTEGRIYLRFFNTTLPKETHVRMCLEHWEASELADKIREALQAKEKAELKLAPHKYVRKNKESKQAEETLTTVAVEKWVREQKSGYAIKVWRNSNTNKPIGHNVSMNATMFRFAAKLLDYLAVSQSWVEVPLASQ